MYDFSRAIVAQIGHKSLIILYYACVLLSTIEMHILVSSWIRRSICIHYAFVLGWSMHNYKIKDWQMIVLLLKSYVINTNEYFRKWKKNPINYVYFHLCLQEVQHNCQLHRISFCADDKTDKRIFTFICKDSESNKHLCYVFDSEKCVSIPDVLGWFVLFYKPGIV